MSSWLSLVVLAFLLGFCQGYIEVELYKRVFRREGVPEKMIPVKEINQLAQRLDSARDEEEVRKAEQEFRLAVRKSYRYKFPMLDLRLAFVNRVVRWIITFQTQLGKLINAFNIPASASANLIRNIRSGYQRESSKHKGDFAKVHKAIEREVLDEAAKWLPKERLNEVERLIAELNKREQQNIKLAYIVTKTT